MPDTLFERHPANPIIRPGRLPWRSCVTFNPGVILDRDGSFLLYERAAGQLRPFHCYIGALRSRDGVRFEHLSDSPVLTPEMAGSVHGSVQDPRVVRIDDLFYMTYAYRPYAWNSNPTGVGVPHSTQAEYPGFDGDPLKNQTRTGIAVSRDGLAWTHHAWATPPDLDDRDVILFPEKIDGRFAILRRPLQFVGPRYGTDHPSIWLSYSTDLRAWSEPTLIARPQFAWEDNRIGASTPPIRTRRGWLVFYHGVENQDRSVQRVCYRLGALLLDERDPSRVIGRTREFIMAPREYYEQFGLYIPNVIFPTGAVVKEGILHLYYGVCDTAIALATAPLEEVLAAI